VLAQQHEQDYQLDYLRLSSGWCAVGRRQMEDAGWCSTDSSHLKLEISNAGNILSRADIPIASRMAAETGGSFAWPDRRGITASQADGKLSLDTGKAVLQIEPESASCSHPQPAAIPKRITLDFGDVSARASNLTIFGYSRHQTGCDFHRQLEN